VKIGQLSICFFSSIYIYSLFPIILQKVMWSCPIFFFAQFSKNWAEKKSGILWNFLDSIDSIDSIVPVPNGVASAPGSARVHDSAKYRRRYRDQRPQGRCLVLVPRPAVPGQISGAGTAVRSPDLMASRPISDSVVSVPTMKAATVVRTIIHGSDHWPDTDQISRSEQ